MHRTPVPLIGGKCWSLSGQSRLGMEKNFQTQGVSEESEFIWNKEQRYSGHHEQSGLTSRQTRESSQVLWVRSELLQPQDRENSHWKVLMIGSGSTG